MHDPWARYTTGRTTTGRDPDRISKVLEELERAWRANPDLRLTQLIVNLETDKPRLYNMEEPTLIAKLRERYPKE